MNWLNRIFFCCFSISFTIAGSTYGQQKDIDSLKQLLAKHTLVNDTVKANLLNQIAFNYYSVNIAELKTYAREALNLSVKLKYKKGEAMACKNIGLGFLGSNANPQALVYFDRALTIYKQLADKTSTVRILNNIGYYYGRVKDHVHEREYLQQALYQVHDINNTFIEAIILGNIGNSFEDQDKPDSALHYYLLSAGELIKSKRPDALIGAYVNLASAYLKLKQYNLSARYCNSALSMVKNNKNYRPKDLAAIYLTLGQLNYHFKKYQLAHSYYQQSLDIGNRIGNPETVTEVYRGYYLIDSVKGKYLSALNNYRQYTRLNDSLTAANKSRILSLYEVKFELQKKAAENERLKIEREKNQATISHQHTTELTLLGGLIIITLGLLYLSRINKRVKEQSEVICKQNQILENNNMVKDKLFSVISHDLRSPITQIIGLLNLWEDGEIKQNEITELTPVVKSGVTQTLELLDNLLIWSNNQLQGFNFHPEPFDLEQIVAINLQTLKLHIAQKKLEVKNDVQPGTMVYADSEMIKIVLRNLINNAVKFTPANGNIHISNVIKNGHVVIVIADTGIGIKEKDQHKIFSFTSHTTLGTDNEKGTGIGLKICKDFIELNQGYIKMESTENIGTRFYVGIPINADSNIQQ